MTRRIAGSLAAITLFISGSAFAQAAPRIERRIELRHRATGRDGAMGGMRGMGARAGMGPRGMGGWGPGMAQALQLSDSQREKLRDIRERQMRRGIQARADLALARLDLRKLMRADRPELGAINGQIDRVARIRTELAKARVASMLEARALLTPEQRQKMREFRERGPMQRRGGMPGMRGGQGADGDEDDPDGDGEL